MISTDNFHPAFFIDTGAYLKMCSRVFEYKANLIFCKPKVFFMSFNERLAHLDSEVLQRINYLYDRDINDAENHIGRIKFLAPFIDQKPELVAVMFVIDSYVRQHLHSDAPPLRPSWQPIDSVVEHVRFSSELAMIHRSKLIEDAIKAEQAS